MKWWIWHNTNGSADEYFLVKTHRVYLKMPKWIGIPLQKLFVFIANCSVN